MAIIMNNLSRSDFEHCRERLGSATEAIEDVIKTVNASVVEDGDTSYASLAVTLEEALSNMHRCQQALLSAAPKPELITFGDLNLKKIREDNNLDFAHYTYKRGMCSCCYGPKDLAACYWKDGVIPEGDEYTYILFKNAHNCSGTKRKQDVIDCTQYIGWRMSPEQLEGVCKDLRAQLGPSYEVVKPEDSCYCIEIRVIDQS